LETRTTGWPDIFRRRISRALRRRSLEGEGGVGGVSGRDGGEEEVVGVTGVGESVGVERGVVIES